MHWHTREFWIAVGINTVVLLLALMLPLGIGLAVWYDNPSWLFLSLFSLIIFMAG